MAALLLKGKKLDGKMGHGHFIAFLNTAYLKLHNRLLHL